ncbi:MAG TPA: carboxypeptidase regulatory-like domain-containing protein, partial [Deltaproteobacteria bacterium]|nr:carboxypeptidase regulatory-like domain-containing protein [Deltaproteobacteria bacterium]
MLLLTASIVSPALSQGFDARGPRPPPDGSTPADAPWVVGPPSPTGAVTLGLSWIEQPIVRLYPDGVVQAVLDDVLTAEVGALSPSLGPVQLGVVLPLVLSTRGEVRATTLADLQLSAPVSLLSGGVGTLRLGPLLRLPTGSPARYLGDRGIGLGGQLSGHHRSGPLVLAADVGLQHDPPTGSPDWPGGALALGALTLGVLPTERLGLHLGWRTRTSLGAPEAPSELGLSLKARAPSGAALSLSTARALTRGIGAPPLRLELAMSLSSPDPEPEPVALDRVAELRVLDRQQRPVRGARIRLEDDRLLQTDADGRVALPPDAMGILYLEAEGLIPDSLEIPEPAVGLDPLLVAVLQHPPVPITLRVVDPQGRPLATPPILEPEPPRPLILDEVGTWHGELPVGEWAVIIGAPGMGRQRRTVTIEPGAARVQIDAVIHPALGARSLELQIRDPQGDPIDRARLTLGDRLLGSTSTGGDLRIEGLPEQVGELIVRTETWDDPHPVQIDPETPRLEVVTRWPDGAVWIEALDPAGHPADAVVAFRGPAPLPPVPLGADGRRLFQLRPGIWTLAVSSPTLGIQERRIEILPGADPVRLTVVLQPEEAGDADLSIAVIGPEGPVAGAQVLLDGEPLGRTGPGGTLRALGLERGLRTLELDAPLLQAPAIDVDLFEGGQLLQIPVSWAPGALEIVVQDPDGEPLDALLTPEGPRRLPAIRLGADGLHRLALPPGRWELGISAEGWGSQQRTLQIPDTAEGLERIRVRLLPRDDDGGALLLEVQDPDGAPVRGARVTLGGQPLGTTTDGGLQISGLPRGATTLHVEAEAMQPVTQRIRIAGSTPIDLALDWAPGALAIDVLGPDGP